MGALSRGFENDPSVSAFLIVRTEEEYQVPDRSSNGGLVDVFYARVPVN